MSVWEYATRVLCAIAVREDDDDVLMGVQEDSGARGVEMVRKGLRLGDVRAGGGGCGWMLAGGRLRGLAGDMGCL